MRFVITGEWRKNKLLRVILGFFLVYTTLFWVTNFILYFGKMGLDPASVASFYRGDEERFMQPRSLVGLAEISHGHLFAMGILVLTLTHLVLFVPVSLRFRGRLVVATFAFALLDELSGWAVRFLHASFAYLKVASFVGTQASLFVLLVLIGLAVAKSGRNGYSDAESQ
ncbi:MAG: hypothetical protein HYY06_25170 [Deltaproteobacteria bacterium]|nr:hypothetical protein [Deltaproteobacteria bacterium]